MKHSNSRKPSSSAGRETRQQLTPGCVFREIETALIDEPADAARSTFDEAALYKLIESVREFGVIEPLLVHADGKRYRVDAGHRRLIAARAIPLAKVPCMVYAEGSEIGEALKHHENAVREDLNAAEEARHFDKLLESKCGGDVDRLCRLVSERREYVEERLNLIHGDERVFQALADSVIKIGVAKELNRVADPARRVMYLEAAMQGGATVRMVRDWRTQGEVFDSYQAGVPVVIPENPDAFKPELTISKPRCYICDSTDDAHDMEFLYVHRSCARVQERMAERNDAAAAAQRQGE